MEWRDQITIRCEILDCQIKTLNGWYQEWHNISFPFDFKKKEKGRTISLFYFLTLMMPLIIFLSIYNRYFWVRFIFVYQKSLKWTLKTVFRVQNHPLNLCSSAVNSIRLLCSQKLVWNVCIEAFWYTNCFYVYYMYIWLNSPCNILQNF